MSEVTTKLLCQNLKKIARLESRLSAKTDFLTPDTELNGVEKRWDFGTIDL